MDEHKEQSERGRRIGGAKKQDNSVYSEAFKKATEPTPCEKQREKTPVHSTDPFKGTNEKLCKVPFFQTVSFRNKNKAEQRKAFFLKKAVEEKPEGDTWENWLSARNSGKTWREHMWSRKKKQGGQNNVALSKDDRWQPNFVAGGLGGAGRAS